LTPGSVSFNIFVSVSKMGLKDAFLFPILSELKNQRYRLDMDPDPMNGDSK